MRDRFRLFKNALDMDWLLKSIIPKRQWPKIVHATKRAITSEEHQRILEGEAAAARSPHPLPFADCPMDFNPFRITRT